MERAHHRTALRRFGRRRSVAVAVLAAIALLLASCSSDDSTAEPSVSDTVTGGTDSDGSILQATTADGGTDDAGDADDGTDDGQDGNSTGDGKTEGASGADDTPGSTSRPDAGGNGFCGSGQPRAIQFDRGASSATIDITASGEERSLYTLEVGAGQIMTVRVDSTDATATAILRAPTTDLPSTGFTERTIVPTREGIYEICIAAGETGADTQLFVSVIDDNTPVRVDESWCGSTVNDRGEIRFDPGMFGTSLEGAVLRDERDVYTIEAGAGQDIDLVLTSLEDNAVFDLRSPSGETLIAGVSDFRIPLPEDGDYLICVGSVRGNASYTLDIAIT